MPRSCSSTIRSISGPPSAREHDDVVDAVDEFGTQRVISMSSRSRLLVSTMSAWRKSIAAAFGVGDPAVVENLQ